MLYCIGVAILVMTIILGVALLFVAAMDAFLAQKTPLLGPHSSAPWQQQKSVGSGQGWWTAAPNQVYKDSALSKHLAETTALHIIGGGDNSFFVYWRRRQPLFSMRR